MTNGSPAIVCLKASNEFDQTEFNKLHLLHGEGGALVDRTQSRDYQKREICSVVSSLSPFVFAKVSAPTAAQVSVSGRVLNQAGRGIAKARVTVILPDGEQRTVLTNPFGYYSFGEINAGSTVIISVSAKNYRFEPSQLVTQAIEDLSDINFTGTRFYKRARTYAVGRSK